MSRVILTWELGRNRGHVANLLSIATRLKARGHTVLTALRDPETALAALSPLDIPCVRAPCHSAKETSRKQAVSYADLLLAQGWSDGRELSQLLQSWISIFEKFQPNVAVLDYSPCARLAARSIGLPCVLIGTGFTLPPLTNPLPPFPDMPWATPQLAADSEQHALQQANVALDSIGASHLKGLYELVDAESRLLLTVPELDQYGSRKEACYVGPIADPDNGQRIDWPINAERRVFAYLRPEMTDFRTIIQSFGLLNASILCYAPGLNLEKFRDVINEKIVFTSRPVQMATVCARAEVCLSYAPAGTVTTTLLNGVPQLLAPFHIESHLTANRVEALGAGLVLRGPQTPRTVASMLDRLLRDPGFKSRARIFADRYRGSDPASNADRVVKQIENVIHRR